MFGTRVLPYRLRVVSPEGTPEVAWGRSLAFPGLRPGEQLTRTTNLPRRATLLADDGSVLAESPPGAGGEEAGSRVSPIGEAAAAVLGTVGPVPAARRAELEAMGVPPRRGRSASAAWSWRSTPACGAAPGVSCWRAAGCWPRSSPHAAAPVHTSISPALQQDTVAALGAQYGGVVLMRPSGQILAVAGIGLEGLQPPGSTFKMVTVSGVLMAHLASPHTVFPYATYATLDGVKLNNANGEECGGTLETAFAVSCNSVFSPLGVKLGAARLVASAERLGFNSPTGIPGAPESTLPRSRRNPGRTGRRLDRHRPGQRARDAAADGDRRRHGRRRRPAPPADLPPPGPAARAGRGAAGVGGEHGQEADDRRGPGRNRHGGGDPGGDGGRQDRHRRTQERLPDHPERPPGNRLRERRPGIVRRQRSPEHRRLVRGLRACAAPAPGGVRADGQRRRRRRHRRARRPARCWKRGCGEGPRRRARRWPSCGGSRGW